MNFNQTIAKVKARTLGEELNRVRNGGKYGKQAFTPEVPAKVLKGGKLVNAS